MIQLRSILEVADNTGARRAAMISRKGQITDTAGVGDIITVNLVEQTAASKKSSATAERNASMAASISAMAKVPLAGTDWYPGKAGF